jgi:hypothetical protein
MNGGEMKYATHRPSSENSALDADAITCAESESSAFTCSVSSPRTRE